MRELHEAFTPAAGEIAWAREQTRAPEHLLALVMLLKSCQVFDFIGEPLVAMTIAVLLAVVTFGYAVGFTGPDISSRIAKSVGPVAAVILIVGAGGGFKQTLIGAGVGDSVAKVV